MSQALPPDVRAACGQLATGGIVLLFGDTLRGGDVDFVTAARSVTPETINFMATHGRGLICLAIPAEHAMRLGIGLLNPGTTRQSGRPFGLSIEARDGVDTGISAADRARTILLAAAPGTTADDITTPGHVFPLITRPGGVLERPAAAEAAVDLCGLAGMGAAAALCAVMRDDGTMARVEDMRLFCAEHGIAMVAVDEIAAVLAARRDWGGER
jgi:3,4-dihydroxy 2-butanone 4-phosphate synthase/GTP cyclohydrolase II